MTELRMADEVVTLWALREPEEEEGEMEDPDSFPFRDLSSLCPSLSSEALDLSLSRRFETLLLLFVSAEPDLLPEEPVEPALPFDRFGFSGNVGSGAKPDVEDGELFSLPVGEGPGRLLMAGIKLFRAPREAELELLGALLGVAPDVVEGRLSSGLSEPGGEEPGLSFALATGSLACGDFATVVERFEELEPVDGASASISFFIDVVEIEGRAVVAEENASVIACRDGVAVASLGELRMITEPKVSPLSELDDSELDSESESSEDDASVDAPPLAGGEPEAGFKSLAAAAT